MRKLVFDNPEELDKKIIRYFEAVKADEKPPTLSGLALFLGTTRQTLLNYINATNTEGTSKKAQCGEMLVMAKAQIECYLEEKMITDYSKGLEFVLKNGYHGWGDKVTVSAEISAKPEEDVAMKAVKMSDEELLDRINVLRARAQEIMQKEGADCGADSR